MVHRVVQTAFGIDAVGRGEGVVDLGGPGFFLKNGDDPLLVGGGVAEALDERVAEPELPSAGVPVGLMTRGGGVDPRGAGKNGGAAAAGAELAGQGSAGVGQDEAGDGGEG